MALVLAISSLHQRSLSVLSVRRKKLGEVNRESILHLQNHNFCRFLQARAFMLWLVPVSTLLRSFLSSMPSLLELIFLS